MATEVRVCRHLTHSSHPPPRRPHRHASRLMILHTSNATTATTVDLVSFRSLRSRVRVSRSRLHQPNEQVPCRLEQCPEIGGCGMTNYFPHSGFCCCSSLTTRQGETSCKFVCQYEYIPTFAPELRLMIVFFFFLAVIVAPVGLLFRAFVRRTRS